MKFNIKCVFLILIICITAFLSLSKVSDPDLWWHLKTGEYIFDNHSIPKTDVFSYYGIENNLNWIAHEWLSDSLFYFIYQNFGFSFLTLFPAIINSIIILLFYYNYKNKESLFFFLYLFVLGITLSLFSDIRPHMFSLLFFSLSIIFLNKFLEEEKTIWLYGIPILSFLWANFHGGSSTLIFILQFILICTSLFNFEYKRIYAVKLDDKKRNKLITIFILSILTSLLNPYGIKMILYPFLNMVDKTMLKLIVEWQSPNLHESIGVVVFILVSIPLSLIILDEKKIKLMDFLILALFSFLSFKMIRQTVYFSIITFGIGIKFIPEIKISNNKNIANGILMLIFVFLLFSQILVFIDNPIDEGNFPSQKVMDTIVDENPKRIFNEYDWGGYLIWELNDKKIYPFIDGRADIFSKYTFEDYNYIYMMGEGWQDILEKYNFDSMLLYKNNKLKYYIENNDDWEIIAEDEKSIFAKKKDLN